MGIVIFFLKKKERDLRSLNRIMFLIQKGRKKKWREKKNRFWLQRSLGFMLEIRSLLTHLGMF